MEPIELATAEETRPFNDLCEALKLTSPGQKKILKELVEGDGPLNAQFRRLCSMMNAGGPLDLLSAEELKYFAALRLQQRHHFPSENEAETLYSAIPKVLSGRVFDEAKIKATYHEVLHYVTAVEGLLKSYREYARAAIERQTNLPAVDNDVSVLTQKIKALSLRKKNLEEEINTFERKDVDRLTQHISIVKAEAQVIYRDRQFYAENYKNAAVMQVFGVMFPSYDRLLSKLKDLQWELRYDDKKKASSTYNKNGPELSEYGIAINDERAAILAEIQSLWDETIPLAHMYVESEYLKPLLDQTQLSVSDHIVQDAAISAYTSAMLRAMNKHLSILASRIKLLVYHHQTLFNAFTHLDAMRTNAMSTAKVCMDKLPTTEAHKVQASEIREARDFTLLEFIQRQMEIYGSIPINVAQNNGSLCTHLKKITKLDEFVRQRHQNGQHLANDMHQFFEAAVKSDLTDAELSGQLLMDCVLADSGRSLQGWAEVFQDAQVEALIKTLQRQAESAQHSFATLSEAGTAAPGSVPGFVALAYQKAAREVAAKHGPGCYKLGEQDDVSCTTCRRDLKFISILRRWGNEGDYIP
ncbi:hypothetical protein F5B20DRAFT_575020 [Whalleya microplaca]|nr:hypothetical protein F5B20DRAFT_575020 [Whalleya microplaca]